MDELSLLDRRSFLSLPPGPDDKESILNDLKTKVESCRQCGLWCNKCVFESGNRDANLIIVGEAPAKTEVATQTLFSGPAGEKLNLILDSEGVKIPRKTVYLCNALKCRLPFSTEKSKLRDPALSEIAACGSYLQGQILAVDPKIIVAVGSSAVKALFGPELGMKKMDAIHGTKHRYTVHNKCYDVFITYHPAAVLDRGDLSYDILEERKNRIWNDWKAIRAQI